MNSTCFLTFSQYMFLHFLQFFYFWKIENNLQVQNVFHFVVDNHRAIMGWSWGDNRRSCETCQISKILTPPRESQISNFQRFWKWTTCFSKYRMFCSDNHEKKRFSPLKSNYLTLNLTIPCDRRTVFKKTCRWSIRPIRYHQNIITYFLPRR